MSAGCPAGFPPCAIEGKPGRAPGGCGGSGSCTEGRWASFLCCLAPEGFWVDGLQALLQVPILSQCIQLLQSPCLYPCRFFCPECGGL